MLPFLNKKDATNKEKIKKLLIVAVFVRFGINKDTGKCVEN